MKNRFLKFLKPDNQLLQHISKPVLEKDLLTEKTKNIIETMLKGAYGEQKDSNKPVLVGLAAPQFGIFKRIILVDLAADGKGKVGDLRIYINPEIIWKSEDVNAWYEGCFSTGKVCGIVSRSVSIKIRALIINNPGFEAIQPPGLVEVEETHKGYVARIFQHEIDHLNGVRFPDLITDPDKLHWVEKKQFPLYRNKQGWKNWPKKCSFEKWRRIRNYGI